MTIPDILPDDHPMLLSPTAAFDFSNDNPKELEELLNKAMVQYNAIGIAANQIGIGKSVAVIMTEQYGTKTLFNPSITWVSSKISKTLEGCLNFPDLRLDIPRPEQCNLTYRDSDNKSCSLYLSGLDAKVAQHELDHLNGIVFTSLISKLQLKRYTKKMKKRLL